MCRVPGSAARGVDHIPGGTRRHSVEASRTRPIVVAVWTVVATPVAAIEGLKNSAALGRSRNLARGQFWHILGTMFLSWVIVMALVLGGALVLGMLLGTVGMPGGLAQMLSGLLMVPLFPLIGVATSLLYYDLRVRSEGADVEAMVNALPQNAV